MRPLTKPPVTGMMLAVVAAAGASAQPASRAVSAEPWQMDARVVQVVSGGSWSDSAARASGHFRVIVRSDGTDSVRFSTMVQWMVREGLEQGVRLAASVDLRSVAPRWHSTLNPEVKMSRGLWVVVVDAADAPARPASRRVTFVLGPPGSVRER